jgi:hypothetical protein
MLRYTAGTRVKSESPLCQPPDTTSELDPGVVRPTRRCVAIPGAVPVLYGVADVTP